MGRTSRLEDSDKPYQFTSFQCRGDLHRKLKVAAAKTDQTMTNLINRALEKYLTAESKGISEVEDDAGFPNQDED